MQGRAEKLSKLVKYKLLLISIKEMFLFPFLEFYVHICYTGPQNFVLKKQ
jgi:hypothetical protein